MDQILGPNVLADQPILVYISLDIQCYSSSWPNTSGFDYLLLSQEIIFRRTICW